MINRELYISPVGLVNDTNFVNHPVISYYEYIN